MKETINTELEDAGTIGCESSCEDSGSMRFDDTIIPLDKREDEPDLEEPNTEERSGAVDFSSGLWMES